MNSLQMVRDRIKDIALDTLGRIGVKQRYNNEAVLFCLGQQMAMSLEQESSKIDHFHDAEFKVYSQWGEDGIIEYLLQSIDDIPETFIEIGVEDYTESNTRFLLKNRNWRGLVVDTDKAAVEKIRNDPLYWRHELSARAQHVTRDNINELLLEQSFEGDVGLLSIDIDGNDYWVWDAIESISPRIVVIEYNSVFGNRHPIVVPYDETFTRSDAHYSNLYFGASLPALVELGKTKGYEFVGCTSSGVNAFFVRADLETPLRVPSAREGYVESKLRESKDESGQLTFISGERRVDVIEDEPVYHTGRDETTLIRNLRPLIDRTE